MTEAPQAGGAPRPLRIAVVTGAFPKLSETFVLEQLVALLALGHDVRVFAFDDPGESIVHAAVHAHGLLERTTYLAKASERLGPGRALVRLLLGAFVSRAALTRRLVHGRQGRFDVIYCHFAHVAELARQLRRAGFFEGPLVAAVHGYDVTTLLAERGERYYAPLFREATRLLPVSEYFRTKLVRLGADPRKVEVRHMGVASATLTYRERELAAGATPRLVSVGRLVEKKGFEHGLRAMALAERRSGRAFQYDIVGDGPLRSRLAGVAEQAGIAGRVVFHGAKSSADTRALLAGAHLLLAPSVTARNGDMEGIPVVLMEAMALGLPVLTTRHSGIPELVEDGVSGVLVPEGDSEALGARLAELVAQPERWAELTRAARRKIESEFDSAELAGGLARDFTAWAHE